MSKLKQLRILIQDFFQYNKRRLKDEPQFERSIYINIANPNIYHRFFYIFLKYFQKEKWNLYFPMSFQKYRNIKHNNRYFGWTINEPELVILKKAPQNVITITDHDLSPNFFNDYFENQNESSGYHFPLSFHPLIYHLNLDEVGFDFEKFNSIYCFGNFDESHYKEIDGTPFEMINRVEILEQCKTFKNYVSVTSSTGIEAIFKNQPEKKLFVVEKSRYEIPIDSVREFLSRFQFYLAAPGVVMPHCHNIIEAMSVNTIPVLQQQYAEMFYPPLRHLHNAIIFKDKEELQNTIEELLWTFTPEQIQNMSKNVSDYYRKHLSPKAVVEKILENLHQKPIYINAEHYSVAQIKKRKQNV